MGIIAFIILGALAGAIAKALLPGDDPGGFIVTILLGLAGSVIGFLIFTELLGIGDNDAFDLGGLIGAIIGGFLAAALFDAHPLDEFFDISTWLTAIVGAIILLLIYRVVTGRNTGRASRV